MDGSANTSESGVSGSVRELNEVCGEWVSVDGVEQMPSACEISPGGAWSVFDKCYQGVDPLSCDMAKRVGSIAQANEASQGGKWMLGVCVESKGNDDRVAQSDCGVDALASGTNCWS